MSVLTATVPSRAKLLLEAYESLISQQLPPGWRWEWVVQEDGPGELRRLLQPLFSRDERVRYYWNGSQSGAGSTRNMALSRCHGEFVRNLDDDDRLLPGALSQDVLALSGDGSLGWAVSPAIDVYSDGSQQSGFDLVSPGRILPGDLVRAWRGVDLKRLPVHPATATYRLSLLWELGGWMGIPFAEDTGLLMAASTMAEGWYGSEPSLLYRKWPGQVTASWVNKGDAKHQTFRVVLKRVETLMNAREQPPSRPTKSLLSTGRRAS